MDSQAEKTINSSNDGTFNVVVYYRYYNDDKYFVVIKNGGIATANSIGKPVYKVITNIGDDDHVHSYDHLDDAFEFIDKQSQHLNALPDTTQAKIKPVLKKMLGSYMFLTTHTTNQILDKMAAANDQLNDQKAKHVINNWIEIIRRNNKDLSDKQQYNQSIKAFDRLYEMVSKMDRANPNVNQLQQTVTMYNNLIARY